MNTRPFRSWDDLPAMQAVCSALLLATPGRAVAHPGDIAWWVGWPSQTVERLAERFLLLEEGGRVIGFASVMHDDADLSVFVDPSIADSRAAIDFEDQALEWASRNGVRVRWVEFEDETNAVQRWLGRGFLPAEEAYLNLTRKLDVEGPDGVEDTRVQPVGDDDVVDRASITHAAFGSPKPFDEYAASYAAFRETPAYPHGWDLLLRDPEAGAASCCIAWPDPVSRSGTFEPVASHPRVHGRGFGKVLLLDGIRRFAQAGMTWAIVGVDVNNPRAEALYRSVGFLPDRTLRIYERP